MPGLGGLGGVPWRPGQADGHLRVDFEPCFVGWERGFSGVEQPPGVR